VAFTVVQSNSATTGSAGSLPVTFTSNVTAGNKIIVASATSAGVTISTSTVKDGAGNSWTEIGHIAINQNEMSLWALDVPAGDAGTAPTMTATFSATCGASVVIQEVSGLLAGNTTAMCDGTAATLTGGSATTGSPTYSTTATAEYLVSVLGDSGTGNTVAAAASGWQLDTHSVNGSANCDCVISWRTAGSTGGSETDGFTAAGNSWAIVEVAFKLAAAAAATPSLAAAMRSITAVVPARIGWQGAQHSL